MDQLTKNEIDFGGALGFGWQKKSQIVCQARANGHFLQRVSTRLLVALGIAEILHPKSRDPFFRRGPNWYLFFDIHGTAETVAGLDGLDLMAFMEKLFAKPAENVVPFRRPLVPA